MWISELEFEEMAHIPPKKSLSNCTAPEAILQHGCLKKSERLFGWHFTRPGQAVHVEKLRKTTGRGNVPS
jgi:hypothetical protein